MNKAKIAKNEGFVRTEQSQSFHSDLNKASVFLHSRIKPKHSLKLNIDNSRDGSAWLSFDREAVHGWVSPGRQCMAGYQQGGSAWLGINSNFAFCSSYSVPKGHVEQCIYLLFIMFHCWKLWGESMVITVPVSKKS